MYCGSYTRLLIALQGASNTDLKKASMEALICCTKPSCSIRSFYILATCCAGTWTQVQKILIDGSASDIKTGYSYSLMQ